MQDNQSGWLKKWPAPAKLNLMLRITGRRSDGYHLLQTVFQIIEFCDWLTFHKSKDNRISLVHPIPGVPEHEDLIIRAARLLQSETGCPGGVHIEVEKNLPMGGGLGGGSSDAATTLVVLNHLWGLNLSVQKLMELGVTLGADVPVFIFGQSAWAEGVGDRLERIELPDHWFVVVKPDCHVVTKDVFCAKDLTRDSKTITIDELRPGQFVNDCQEVVLKMYRQVAEAWAALSTYGDARLTGTGACVFAQFENKISAKNVYDALKNEGWQVYLAKGVSSSPLQRQLKHSENQ